LIEITHDPLTSGAYVLRIQVETALNVVFGRFRGGSSIPVPAGAYLYVGSAMGQRGSATLCVRLLRHATRCDGPRHLLWATLAAHCSHGHDTGSNSGKAKRLRWHIDYLLEETEAQLVAAYVLAGSSPVEMILARHLADDPCTFALASGLGASDNHGGTHLLGVRAEAAWWQELPMRLAAWAVV
jgi:Uri superfamily endonuclease